MLPVIAIVGRPNVGKSTLFNRLAKNRDALVDDSPGITRDRLYTTVEWDGKEMLMVDTGGFDTSGEGILSDQIKVQVEMAIQESILAIFLLDGRSGLMEGDRELYSLLRNSGKKVICAVNKVDGPEHEVLCTEFYSLGINNLFPVSAAHGYGINSLMDRLVLELPFYERPGGKEDRIRIAIVGRPNVGKSSLINRIVGFDRLIVSELPGTTRDTVDISFEREGKSYLLVDTGGLRRKSRVTEKIEKVAAIKALKAIDRCHISVILFDSVEGVSKQDARICGYTFDKSRAMIMAINKWDLIEGNRASLNAVEREFKRQLGFASFAPAIKISALTGKNVHKLFALIDTVWAHYNIHVPTPVVNKALEEAVTRQPPAAVGGKRPKLFYATQASVRPPCFVIFVNRKDRIQTSYKRFLVNYFRESLDLGPVPVKIIFKER